MYSPLEPAARPNNLLKQENLWLRERLDEYEQTLEAIRNGQVDALVGNGDVFTLESAGSASNRFRGQVLTQIHDSVVAVDGEGHIIYINPAAEEQYGRTASEVLGLRLNELFGTRWEVPEDGAAHEDALAKGDSWRGESIHVKLSGEEIRVESSVSVMRDADGAPIGRLAVIRDISQRMKAQMELQESAKQKDHFLATLAHELRNPLSPLMNGLLLFKDSQCEPGTVAMMQRQLDHMVRLVDDLMDVSRISRGKLELRKERVSIGPVVRMAVETSRPLMDRNGHTFKLHMGSAPLWVNGDATRLIQIISNLLNNAAKYTPRAGHIDLFVDERHGEAIVRVKDNGIGIEAPALERMFDMFAQVENRSYGPGGGLGIGLNIAKRLAIMHEGRLDGTSRGPGQGSEFTLSLPLAAQREPLKPSNAPAAKDPSGHVMRILVVDDNEDGTLTMSLILRKQGHLVEVANDGAQALAIGRNFAPDLVLMDIGMPVMNGYEACELMREETWGKNARIVALSGWGQEQDRQRSFGAGFDEHVVKPIDMHTLRRLINTPMARVENA